MITRAAQPINPMNPARQQQRAQTPGGIASAPIPPVLPQQQGGQK